MRIYLETFGCQMNKLDSALLRSALTADGFHMASDASDADAILFNTCCVRQHAEDRVIDRVLLLAKVKLGRPGLIVGIIGCMAQRDAEALFARMPHLDMAVGPAHLAEIPAILRRCRDGVGPVIAVEAERARRPLAAETRESLEHLDLARDLHADTTAFSAYVRIMRGCDRFCSYCIVPFVRGRQVSRPTAHIVDEVRRLADRGIREVTLLGQNVNDFHDSGADSDADLSHLLRELSDIDSLWRIRFVTSHPMNMTESILAAVGELPRVCGYLHMPAQSGSDAVLKRMNRGYTRQQYIDLVERARELIDGVAIASDFIVGFPGETEADFAATSDLVRRCRFKNSFIFKYSPRPGTAAEKMADDVPTDIKKFRNNALLAVQEETSVVDHRRFIGLAVEVLVEGPSRLARKPDSAHPRQLVGRTQTNHIVVFDADKSLVGTLATVHIESATALTLLGCVVSR